MLLTAFTTNAPSFAAPLQFALDSSTNEIQSDLTLIEGAVDPGCSAVSQRELQTLRKLLFAPAS